jgi:hypothetical protein
MSEDPLRLEGACNYAMELIRGGTFPPYAIAEAADECGVERGAVGRALQARKNPPEWVYQEPVEPVPWGVWTDSGLTPPRGEFISRRIAHGITVADIARRANLRGEVIERKKRRSVLYLGWVHQFEDGELVPGQKPPRGYVGPAWTPRTVRTLFEALDACIEEKTNQ